MLSRDMYLKISDTLNFTGFCMYLYLKEKLTCQNKSIDATKWMTF